MTTISEIKAYLRGKTCVRCECGYAAKWEEEHGRWVEHDEPEGVYR